MAGSDELSSATQRPAAFRRRRVAVCLAGAIALHFLAIGLWQPPGSSALTPAIHFTLVPHPVPVKAESSSPVQEEPFEPKVETPPSPESQPAASGPAAESSEPAPAPDDEPYNSEDFLPLDKLSRLPVATSPSLDLITSGIDDASVRVQLVLFIDELGRVPRITLDDDPALSPALREAMLNAISGTTFTPARRGAQAVKAMIRFEASVQGQRLTLVPLDKP